MILKYDKLIFIGDIHECLKLARQMRLPCVKGNHENKFIKWYTSGARTDSHHYKDYYSQFSQEDISYIMSMPLYIELDDVIAVHAGIKPGIFMPDQTPDDCMYLRYTD